ncbi:MAG: methyltransferase domain-containing protein [Anaerolineae bacterium]
MSIKVEQLLFSYYERSYPGHLGISFPSKLAHRFRGLDEYVQKALPEYATRTVWTRLRHYRNHVAPFVKTKPLLDFLDNHRNFQPAYLLDFGCGAGHIIKYLATHLGSLRAIWGIDPDASILSVSEEVHRQGLPKTLWHTSLSEAGIPDHSCNLIIAVHALHHLERDEQSRILSHLLALLKPGGVLYIYEDSWTLASQLSLSTLVDLDSCFGELSTEQKLRVFELNEYWSNAWCYGRFLDTDKSRYRSLEEWSALLISNDLELVDIGATGFDVRRIHGVPSAWLIGRRSG